MLNSQVCDTQVAAEERDDRETRCYNEQVHVLAVDDCRIDLKIIEKLLKTFSFKVTAVESAEKALEMLGLGLSDEPNACNGFKVNLIITDYCMPGMSGYDLLKKVKEARALQDIPVVIISSEHIPQRITTCLEEGAEDFIMKPVKVADIVRLNGRLKEPRKSGAGTRSSSNEDASTNCNHDDKDHDQGSGTVAVGAGRKRKAISSSGGSSNKKSSSFASVVFQNQREGLR